MGSADEEEEVKTTTLDSTASEAVNDEALRKRAEAAGDKEGPPKKKTKSTGPRQKRSRRKTRSQSRRPQNAEERSRVEPGIAVTRGFKGTTKKAKVLNKEERAYR